MRRLSISRGRTRSFAGIALAMIAGLILSGCSLFAPETYHALDSIASQRPELSVALERYYEQTVSWSACDGGDFCARIRVPLDWQHITQKSIGIALVKHKATGTREGSILVNPGGPGGSGVQFVADGVHEAVDSDLSKNFDIVGFDPRGVGESHGVRCFSDAAQDRYLYDIIPYPIGSSRWVESEFVRAASLARACEVHTGPLIGQIDTVSAANDMDVIRYALGSAKLNYLGYSYGTYLGTVYAGLYPQNVGRMVLDGAEYPWPSASLTAFGITVDSDGAVAQAVGFEDDFYAYLRECTEGSSEALGDAGTCPLGKGLAGAKKKVEADLATLDAHPLTDGDGRKLGSATLATAIEEALYDPADWPQLTRLFAELKHRDPTEAFTLADYYNYRESDGTYDDNNVVAHLAIDCLEEGHDVQLDYDAAELTALKRLAPILGPYAAYPDLECSGWKYGPSVFPDPIRAAGSGPILVVGTTGDPATPYRNARLLAKLLDGGHLVTFHGEGHTAYDRGDSCINRTVDSYFIAGAVPKTDPQCH